MSGFEAFDANSNLKITASFTTTEITFTTTGNIDDLDFQNASVIRMNNASPTTIRGLKAGVAGQRVTIVAVGFATLLLAHQDTNSAAANRLINFVTSASTPVFGGHGTATLQYDATSQRWRLIHHEQGTWITPTFSAGDFTASGAMTWTVDIGDVVAFTYCVVGRAVIVAFQLATTTIGGTPDTTLKIGNGQWGGFTISSAAFNRCAFTNNPADVFIQALSGTTSIGLLITTGANWTTGTNDRYVYGEIMFPVT